MPPAELQEVLWQQCFSGPTQWWGKRRTPRHADFKHKKSKAALWPDKRHKPGWVAPQLALSEARRNVWVSTSVQRQGPPQDYLDVGRCRKLCEDGRITDSVDALNLLVQQGCRKIPNNLFYRVLKVCIAHKDLGLGRRIHALTIRSGLDGDAFLATHLIGLYASHGRLDEAMRVFAKVSTPDAYNWAAIIFAYARHGEAAQAIRLYGQMLESTVKPDNRTYIAVLKACSIAGDLAAGKAVHAQIVASPGKPDIFVHTSLIDMYAKCGSLEDARRIFDELPERNVVTWTAMIAGYTQQGMGQEALSLYHRMQQEGLTPPGAVTFVCLLQACASLGEEALHQGKELHAKILAKGLQHDVVLGGSLVNMYTRCGSLLDARRVFDNLPCRDVVTWNVLLGGYAQQGMGEEVLGLYSTMQQEGTAPSSVTFAYLVRACASVGAGALHEGKQLHAQIAKQGLEGNVVLGASLVNMYSKCGSLENARRVFDRLPQKNVVTWTAMLAGYTQQDMGEEALSLYSSMPQECLGRISRVTFVCLLQACASIGVAALHQGRKLHTQIEEHALENDVVLGGSLVNMYAKCGSLEEARRVFDKLPERNTVTWTGMMAGYAQQGMGQVALSLYDSMQQEGLTLPSPVTFVCLLQACASVGAGALHQGEQLHVQIKERGLLDDIALGGSLVNMYAKCGSLEVARSVFDGLPAKNVVTWNAMLAGYIQQGLSQEALSLFSKMQQEGITSPDSFTFACLLQACGKLAALPLGKLLHSEIEEQALQADVVIGTCLIDMYVKCDNLEDARKVFDKLPHKNVVVWNAMLAGYAQQGMGQETLSLYRSMEQEGMMFPDPVTFVCLIQACASVASLPLGKQLHAQIQDRGLQGDHAVGAALIHMYAKCGSMFESQKVFDSLPEKTIEAWGALIGGYTRQGNSDVVFDLLKSMILEGMHPDGMVFLSVLTACSHVGLLDKGRRYFEAMKTDYGISPTVEHYTCMLDLLGRAGHLDEALQMAKTLPFPPDVAVWVTLLAACQKWNNIEIGHQAFEFAVSVDVKDATSYVLMSNIFARAEMWEEAKEIQARRAKVKAWKQAGQSWTDLGGVVHTFVVGDKRHTQSEAANT